MQRAAIRSSEDGHGHDDAVEKEGGVVERRNDYFAMPRKTLGVTGRQNGLVGKALETQLASIVHRETLSFDQGRPILTMSGKDRAEKIAQPNIEIE